ncbi:hypothetical protein BH24ACT26_BH24ACT26_17180 [soil metagenome]
MATDARRVPAVRWQELTKRAAALEEELRQKTALFELFQDVTDAANDSSSSDAALQVCLDKVCAYAGWPVGHVYAVEGRSGALVSTDVWHLDPGDALAQFRRAADGIVLQPGAGLPGRVLCSKRPAWVSDISKDQDFPRAAIARDAGLRSGIAFPASSGTEVVAVLEFFSRAALRIDEPLLGALEQIGSQFGRVVERKRAEEALRHSDALKAAVLESALDCIISADHDGKIIDFNPAAESTFGYRCGDVIGEELAEIIFPPALLDAHRRWMTHYLATGEGPVLGQRIEVTGMRADGSEFPIELAINALHLGGQPVFTAYLRDITERKRLEAALEHEAWHDSLTDLANRTLFLDRVEHALARSDRRKEHHSVIYLDLDNFKDVNDSMGHAVGDELLVKVAELLRRRLRPGDTVARLGGDEFAVLLEDTDTATAERVAERVLEGLEAPLELEDSAIEVRASLGIACGAAGVTKADELLKRADEAMYEAKASEDSAVRTMP